MAEYIARSAAICIADYAADEHPYEKCPGKTETFSEYNQGWNDACDYIREQLENAEKDVVAIAEKRGEWEGTADGYADGELVYDMWNCSECGFDADGSDEKPQWNYCPNCGAKMGGGAADAEE